jgi:hypothetical protein
MKTLDNGYGDKQPILELGGKSVVIFSSMATAEDFFDCDFGTNDAPMYYREPEVPGVIVTVDDALAFDDDVAVIVVNED